jgi:cobalt transporter subunit CbtA
MSLFRNIVLAAVIAGLLSGLLLTLMQSVTTVPLILQAEVYEKAEEAPAAPQHDHGAAAQAGTTTAMAAPQADAHEHGAEAWEPADGLERTFYTAAADILAAIGFALLLITVSESLGTLSGWRQGFFFGLSGFAVFSLAPGLGLAPELPGMPAAPLDPRQVWWVATAVCTAVGLGLIAYGRTAAMAALAVIIMVAPHLYGAPVAPSHETAVPGELYARFVSAVFSTNFVFWAVLGTLCGVVRARLRAGEPMLIAKPAEVAAR